ncbi:hypothetical protein M9Y10_013096 [Tritrichomonas musculus]|uniref:Intimal thickness related receptor IRP domain-containing protein n=1 Tax=Tritrichomonas musculus TaxID=1915356 RepID=A0ABR2I683_9EUKA
MSTVLNNESTSQPGFKFEQSLDIYHFVSLLVSSVVFILMLTYTFQHVDSSFVTTNYKGLLTQEPNNTFYFVEVVPPLKNRQNLITFVRVNFRSPIHISVRSNIICQWKNNPSNIIKQNLNNATNGVYQIFNTKVFLDKTIIFQLRISLVSGRIGKKSNTINGRKEFIAKSFFYEIILSRILNFFNYINNAIQNRFAFTNLDNPDSTFNVESNLNLDSIISLDTIQNDTEFGENIIFLRILFSIISLCALIFFIFLVLFYSKVNPNSFRFEQYLTVISLILSTLANFPFSHFSNTISSHFFEALFLGFFDALNVAALYLFVQKANGQNVYSALPFTFLFLLSQAFLNLSSDSAFLYLYFEDNYAVALFFSTVSFIAHAVFIVLFIQSIISSLCSARLTRKKLFISYSLAFFVMFIPLCTKMLSFAFNGYSNFSFSFCYDYMAQTFLSLLFTDLHWPLIIGSSRVTTIGALGEDELILHVSEPA